MKIIAIRPKKKGKRLKNKDALYTVAFDVGELLRFDSSFNSFCRNYCKYGCRSECNERCNDSGEYGRLLYLWQEQAYLLFYFKNNVKYLDSDRYDHIDIKQAIKRHYVLVQKVEKYILTGDLSSFFIPLYNHYDKEAYRPDLKYKSDPHFYVKENWIRIYAIKFTDDKGVNNYIITGGGIKLFKTMSESSVVEHEEKKQDMVIKFLVDNNITSRDKIETLVL